VCICKAPDSHKLTGFTAIVDKQLSAKYETLVNEASELIKVLPWGKDFEVGEIVLGLAEANYAMHRWMFSASPTSLLLKY
jgi:hypothetical protein